MNWREMGLDRLRLELSKRLEDPEDVARLFRAARARDQEFDAELDELFSS